MHGRSSKGSRAGLWECGSHRLPEKSCGMKGAIPEKVLKQECAAVLGLVIFDEKEFTARIEKIVVPKPHVLVFHFKDGQTATQRWVSTAKKDCWTNEHKGRQRAWMRRYMASGKKTRYSAFTTRVKCAICGSSFRRNLQQTKHGPSVHWRCSRGGKCASISIREEELNFKDGQIMKLSKEAGGKWQEK